MCLLHIFLEKGVAAEARIDLVIVAAGVAVIGLVFLVIEEERGAPDRSGTEVGDVVEMVDDSLEVTSMAAERFVPGSLFLGVKRIVVAWVCIGETVGTDEIDEVGGCKTLP